MKSSKVSIKTRSTPASLSFKGQATKHTTVKWSIAEYLQAHRLFLKGKPCVLVITPREITMEYNRNSSYIPT